MTSGLSADGANMLAQLVQANVDMAAHTTNLLLDGKDADIRDLAETVVDLVEDLMKIPEYSRPVIIDHLLGKHAGGISHAYRVVDKT